MSRPHSLTVLITGAGSGIGQALAQHFAAKSCRVIAADIDGDAVRRLACELQRSGATAEALVMDVASTAGIEQAIAGLAGNPPDVLVNNAGLQYVAPLEQFPPQQWQKLIDIMLTGSAMLTRAVLPGMRSRGFGRIVNIGSIHALVASPF